MTRVLIVGAGGVGGVVAHKCAQLKSVFDEVILASRTLSRCEKIRDQIKELHGRDIQVAQLDADEVDFHLATHPKPALWLSRFGKCWKFPCAGQDVVLLLVKTVVTNPT